MTVISTNIPGGDDVNALVLDVGSDKFRAGFAGEDIPRILENSAFRFSSDTEMDTSSKIRPRHSPANFYVPSSSCEARQALQVDAKDGCIDIDQEVLEQIIQHSFQNVSKGFAADVAESPMIMSEPNKATVKYRRTCLETLFERFDFPAASLLKRAAGSAFSVGKQSGLVVDIGASMTSATPVFDGFVLQKPTAEHVGIGGDLLDTILDELLKKKRVAVAPFYKKTEGVSAKYLTASRLAVVKELKHELCRLSTSSLSGVPGYANWHLNVPAGDHPATSVLPDGTAVDLAPFHYVIPELLFDPVPVHAIPNLAHTVQNFRGIGVSVLETVANCDVDARKAVSSDIILTGGSSLFVNMPDRLLKFVTSSEVGKLANPLIPLVKTKVTAPPVSVDRMSSSWLGCSIIASCATFQQLWISKRQYEEDGLDRIASKQLFW